MGDVLLFLCFCGFSAWLGWSLGVRRERGKQYKRDQIRADTGRKKGGLKLHRLTVRR